MWSQIEVVGLICSMTDRDEDMMWEDGEDDR